MTNETVADTTETIDWEARALKAEAKIIADKQAAKEAVKEPVKEEPVVKEEANAVEDPKEGVTATKENTTKTVAELEAEIEAIKTEAEIKANQETTNMMSISGKEKTSDNATYSKAELETMTQEEYNIAKDRLEKGEATYA